MALFLRWQMILCNKTLKYTAMEPLTPPNHAVNVYNTNNRQMAVSKKATVTTWFLNDVSYYTRIKQLQCQVSVF